MNTKDIKMSEHEMMTRFKRKVDLGLIDPFEPKKPRKVKETGTE